MRETMKKKRMTPEEFDAWWNAREARIQALRARAKLIQAELALHKKQT
jgi:cephalosporin-C deacetylase-like acetyl esterase